MKLYFLIFAIAIMVQATVAALFRDVVKAKELNKILLSTEALFKNTLEDIPKTPVYAKYVKHIEEYLIAMEEYKKNTGDCITKTNDMLQKFVKVIGDVSDDTPEATEINRILENNDAVKFVEDIAAINDKLKGPAYDNQLHDLIRQGGSKIVSFVQEAC